MSAVAGERIMYPDYESSTAVVRRWMGRLLFVAFVGWMITQVVCGAAPVEKAFNLLPFGWWTVSLPFVIPRALGLIWAWIAWRAITDDAERGVPGDDGFGLGLMVLLWLVLVAISGLLVWSGWFGYGLLLVLTLAASFYLTIAFNENGGWPGIGFATMYVTSAIAIWTGLQTAAFFALVMFGAAVVWAVAKIVLFGLAVSTAER